MVIVGQSRHRKLDLGIGRQWIDRQVRKLTVRHCRRLEKMSRRVRSSRDELRRLSGRGQQEQFADRDRKSNPFTVSASKSFSTTTHSSILTHIINLCSFSPA